MSIEDVKNLIKTLPEPLEFDRAWSFSDTTKVWKAIEKVYDIWHESNQYELTMPERRKIDFQMRRAAGQLARLIESSDKRSSDYDRFTRRGPLYRNWCALFEQIAEELGISQQHLQSMVE